MVQQEDVEQALSPRSTTSSARIPAARLEESEDHDAVQCLPSLQDVKASLLFVAVLLHHSHPADCTQAVQCSLNKCVQQCDVESWARHLCEVVKMHHKHRQPFLGCDSSARRVVWL